MLALHGVGSIDPDLLVHKPGSCAQVPAVSGQSVLGGQGGYESMVCNGSCLKDCPLVITL